MGIGLGTDHVTGGVGLVPSYTRLVVRGRGVASPAPSTTFVTCPTSKFSPGSCGRWSAVSSSDIPPGYVARAWFRYGIACIETCILRGCSRAWALLWREVAEPSHVSRSASCIDRGGLDWLDKHHSIQYP